MEERMKYIYNDGSIAENAIQNRFTAYLKIALNHNKIQYSKKLKQKQLLEITHEESEVLQVHLDKSFSFEFAISCEIENTRLHEAFFQLKELEQKILVMHIFQDKQLKQIALELSIPYSTIKSLYRRSLNKLRKELEKNEF